MLTVLRVHLPSEIPIVGCEITPYVLIKRPDNSVTTDDIPESAPIGGYCMKYIWYRVQSDKKIDICSVHPTEQATLQCIGCIKAKVNIAKSYHCSTKCFHDSWQHHRVLHERAQAVLNENGNNDDDESTSRVGSNGSSSANPATVTKKGETWYEVGYSRTYTPTAEDIGHVLKFECVPIDAETRIPVGISSTFLTSRVIPAPSPTPRRMIPIIDVHARLDRSGTFSVLSYNILADVYASSETYSYCPSWALAWTYRRQNLLREIVGYHADILCLQEVQSDHYEEFFAPELDKHGYESLFKNKTLEVYAGHPTTIDGCATFFRRDKFSHVKKYEVEFNKAAQSLTDAMIPVHQKKTALNRLIKDNIALIVVLEAKFNIHGHDIPGKRQLLCVANTHINVQQDHKDVKLWQTQTLLKGLEKIAVSADIPMLVCGDFSSIPGSAPHTLLAAGKIDQIHPDLAIDPLNILRPSSRLFHQLPLVSAYSALARTIGLEQQRRKLDPATDEPLFTSCTRDFIGTLDYIFYTADSLIVESLLELVDEECLRKDTALPSPEWSSDHIALLAQFQCIPKIRR